MKLTKIQQRDIDSITPSLKDLFTIGVYAGTHWRDIGDVKPFIKDATVTIFKAYHKYLNIIDMNVMLHMDPRLSASVKPLNIPEWAKKYNYELLNVWYSMDLDSPTLYICIKCPRIRRIFHIHPRVS